MNPIILQNFLHEYSQILGYAIYFLMIPIIGGYRRFNNKISVINEQLKESNKALEDVKLGVARMEGKIEAILNLKKI